MSTKNTSHRGKAVVPGLLPPVEPSYPLAMAGELSGHYFKSVIGSLIMGHVIFPEMKARIDAMSGDEWYEWDEFVALGRKIEEKLSPLTLRKVGQSVVVHSKEIFVSQGFDSAEKMFSDYGVLFLANVRGAPPEDCMMTLSFEPNRAVIAVGAQPQALCEGYLRGILRMFGHSVSNVAPILVQGKPALEVRW